MNLLVQHISASVCNKVYRPRPTCRIYSIVSLSCFTITTRCAANLHQYSSVVARKRFSPLRLVLLAYIVGFDQRRAAVCLSSTIVNVSVWSSSTNVDEQCSFGRTSISAVFCGINSIICFDPGTSGGAGQRQSERVWEGRWEGREGGTRKRRWMGDTPVHEQFLDPPLPYSEHSD